VRALVFGGRDFKNRASAFQYLDTIHSITPITLIIEGGMTGADRLGRQWAQARGVPFKTWEADWDDLDHPKAVIKRNRSGKLYNAAAGPIRNEKMLRESRPDAAIGFPGGSGTLDMVKRCLLYGLTPARP
jgi:predicted Rossmann-fold nucleotide-binding protein